WTTLDRFLAYPWPGNVRELENVLTRIVVLGTEDLVAVELAERRPGLVAPRAPCARRWPFADQRGSGGGDRWRAQGGRRARGQGRRARRASSGARPHALAARRSGTPAQDQLPDVASKDRRARTEPPPLIEELR